MLDQSFRNISISEKALDGSWARHEALSNNLANVNTPGYKRQDVDFDKVLSEFLSESKMKMFKTNEKHFPVGGESLQSLTPTIERELNTSFRKDGNNVNIDVEMAELAKNQLKFNAVTAQLNSKISRIKLAIRDGG